MKNVLVAVAVCFVSVFNLAAQWTAPATASATTPIHYDGNVGIGTGTAAPATKLQVVGSSLFNGIYAGFNDSVSLGNADNGQMIRFGNATSPTDLMLVSYGPAGKVAIGTNTAPLNKLYVYSTGLADGLSIDGTLNPAVVLRSNASIKGYGPAVASTDYAYFTNTLAGDMIFRSEANNILFGRGSGQSTLAIVGPLVGIGTSAPEAKLTLGAITAGRTNAATILNARSANVGNSTGAYVYPFELQTGTSGSLERLQIGSYRRVAGTDWQGAGWRIQSAVDDSFTDGSKAFIELGPSDPNIAGGGFIAIGTGGQDRLAISSSGNVGIGAAPAAAYLLTVGGDANFTGTVTGTNIKAQYQDVAEWVPMGEKVEDGMVVVVATNATNTVIPSAHSYDTRVAGVVSAHPGLILGQGSATKAQIATTGRVKVRVDATKHPIAIGDLLVTSDKPGMAMFSEPVELSGIKFHRPGTLIGKALEPLPNGEGEILVLLSLQ